MYAILTGHNSNVRKHKQSNIRIFEFINIIVNQNSVIDKLRNPDLQGKLISLKTVSKLYSKFLYPTFHQSVKATFL